MSKKKYRYNPKTLAYEEVTNSIPKQILKVLLLVAPSILIGLMLSFLFTKQLSSPKEKRLAREVKVYSKEMKRMNADMALVNRVLKDIEKRDEDLYRVALYADEFPKELRMMGTGGSDKYTELSGLTNSKLLIETAKNLDAAEKRLNAQRLSFKELLVLAKDKEKVLASIPAIQPVRNDDLKRMASGYGWRIDPIYKTSRMHTGMDFTAKVGTEVFATGDGVIEALERNGWGYGQSIVINHGYGYKTRYAHLSAFKVKAGQKVKRGDLIGLIGSTGKSTGPHLHYEVEKNGEKVNPIHYYHSDLTPAQYERLLEMSKNTYKAFD
jgi:murein DD-endopeptidase MepM/ murein hydrolase activator NlpD|tara:strand:+ start:14306 stop:15277 length:972 start_codon:yes stop_codon:yes gene_type:complete